MRLCTSRHKSILMTSQTSFQLVVEDLKNVNDLAYYFENEQSAAMTAILKEDEDFATKGSFESFMHQLANLAYDLMGKNI